MNNNLIKHCKNEWAQRMKLLEKERIASREKVVKELQKQVIEFGERYLSATPSIVHGSEDIFDCEGLLLRGTSQGVVILVQCSNCGMYCDSEIVDAYDTNAYSMLARIGELLSKGPNNHDQSECKKEQRRGLTKLFGFDSPINGDESR